jgi:hypothetical protein
MIRTRLSRAVLWIIQLASLCTILYCSWLLLDREVFALVAASIVLFASLYLEHTTAGDEP